MIVAVVSVRVVEVTRNQVVDVVAVRDLVVTTGGAVGVGFVVATAGVVRRAGRRMGRVDGNGDVRGVAHGDDGKPGSAGGQADGDESCSRVDLIVKIRIILI